MRRQIGACFPGVLLVSAFCISIYIYGGSRRFATAAIRLHLRLHQRFWIIFRRWRIFCFLKVSAVVSDTAVIERQSSFLHFGQTRPEQSNTVSASTVSLYPHAAQPSVTLNFIWLPPVVAS